MIAAAFWVCIACIVYTYLVYPLILVVWSGLRRDEATARPRGSDTKGPAKNLCPKVTLVIAAYNEEHVIGEKLSNLRRLSYPEGLLDVVIGSDGSSDRTAEIIRKSGMASVQVVEFPSRRGKASVLNDLVPKAKGDVVVLSDANTLFEPDTVKNLVRHFADPDVGAVCGELLLLSDSRSSAAVGEGSYWRIENAIKRMESEIGSTVGATGAVYAIRRELFVPLPAHKPTTDDFITPLNVVRQGLSVRYDADAVATERTNSSMQREFRRKVRIGAANFSMISEFAPLLSPDAGFVSFALWSRKIIRWCVPFFLIVAFLASLLLAPGSPFFRVVLIVELALLVLGAVGYFCERASLRIGVLGLPFYFLAMNAALLLGFYRFLFHRERPTWEPVR